MNCRFATEFWSHRSWCNPKKFISGIAMIGRYPRYVSLASVHPLLALLFLSSFTPNVLALKLTDVPTFRIRVRVTSVGGEQPTGHKFPIHFQTLSAEADGPNWSSWLVYDALQVS